MYNLKMSKCNLKNLHLNCRSICNERAELKNLVKALGHDTIYGLCETSFSEINNKKYMGFKY